MRIAFGHQARVGKDTCAEYFCKRCGTGSVLRFSHKLKEIAGNVQQTLGKPIEKDPSLLQFLGTGLRDVYGKDVWVSQVEKQIQQEEKMNGIKANIVISDLRFPNEAKMLQSHSFILVKIVRKDRPIDRDPTHISETALSTFPFDYTIHNDGTLEDLYSQLDELFLKVHAFI